MTEATFKVTPELINDLIKEYKEGDLAILAKKHGLRDERHVRQVAQQIRSYGVPIPSREVGGTIKNVVMEWKRINENTKPDNK